MNIRYFLLNALALFSAITFSVYLVSILGLFGLSMKLTNSTTNNLELELQADGYYYFIKHHPEKFEEIKLIRIETMDTKAEPENGKVVKLSKPKGFVQSFEKYDFEMLNVSGNQIEFITEQIDGNSYQFKGCWVDSKFLRFPAKNEKHLVGLLIKKSYNKTIAETKFDLGMYGDLLCSL